MNKNKQQQNADQHTTPETVGKRLKKSARVDEQLFQEGLAIDLDNERRAQPPTGSTPAKRGADAMPNKAPETIVTEFQTMIDGMLPSTKQERQACTRAPRKAEVGQEEPQEKQKKAVEKRSGKSRHGKRGKKKKARG
ncbi:MAG: hypothetical protein H7837_07425 [Magnetococcus sp. MYC-9]